MSKSTPDALPMHLIDSDAERFVLACILAGEFEQARGELTEVDFAVPEHARVWRISAELADAGEEPSASGVMRIAMERNYTGLTFDRILDIAKYGGRGFSLGGWIRHLRRRALDRQAFRLGKFIQERTAQGYTVHADEIRDARERLASVESALAEVPRQKGTIGELVDSCGGLDGLFRRPEGLIELPTPRWRALMNGGLAPGAVTVLAARTGVGKTALGLQVAMAAAEGGRRTCFISLEMGKAELLKRMISYRGGIDFGDLVRGSLSREQRDCVRRIASLIDAWPLSLHCDVHTVGAVEAILAKARPRLEFVVVDYLGLLQGDRRAETRNLELGGISRRLKLLALSGTGTPFLVLHQLNRASETENRRPMLSDLRDSGSIEQDADAVLFLHQPRKPDWPRGQIELIIAKQRNGIRDIQIPMKFNGELMRFAEAEP